MTKPILGTAATVIEQRMMSTRSDKLIVIDVNGVEVGSMNRPLDMSHFDFLTAYNNLISGHDNDEIANMSAMHTAKRGQSLDSVPSTFTVKLR